MRAFIIHSSYYNDDGTQMTIGGIQTYISNLVGVLHELGYNITICQLGNIDHDIFPDDAHIHFCKKTGNYKKDKNKLRDYCLKKIDNFEDVLIYASDAFVCKRDPCRSIAIQHGITWDIPLEETNKPKRFLLLARKTISAWRTITRVEKVDELVCVDYNFLNWYRAVSPVLNFRYKIIPNFTEVRRLPNKSDDGRIRIIFARRLFKYRGTDIFSKAIKRILDKYDNVEVTVAGEGPEEGKMREILSGKEKVRFIKYKSEDSMSIHASQDIAIIPTIGSEGTSLSLLEAMGSGCATICTNVGGMTNIVLDGFNGKMIKPEIDDIVEAVEDLIRNREKRKQIAKNGYDTIIYSFSKEKWENEWKKLIIEVMKTEKSGGERHSLENKL